MQKIYRILIVVIITLTLVVVALDYFGFHGSILLGQVGNGVIVSVFDTIINLFFGSNSFTNLAFAAVIAIGLLVGVMAIMYKFIKG
ncbi:MAG TPA: hypothetical protein VMC84_00635 [Methanocella sp.]|uniref:hypothetical protein n=1 Tax=Methanocella sp. TaxID=2052833 RepID=UPI002C0808ED|nr:hypothetical protein [Methanocella sp.]HTY89660.1 hypothetical protein [Methanocella sp.]